jgi:GTP-binding protein
VAPYPFTTLVPCLGVAAVGERRFVVADIPGLIEGASLGAGLGDRFLRHVERTRVLVHLLDASALLLEDRDPAADYATVRRELGAYDPRLLERDEIIALNKIDLVADRDRIDALAKALAASGRPVFQVSGATGEGADRLLGAMAGMLAAAEAREAEAGP